MAIVILDTSIITLLVTNPDDSKEAEECQEWFYYLMSRGVFFNIAEICDYEVRRGILFQELQFKKSQAYKLNELDQLKSLIESLPFSEDVSKIAATFWAKAMFSGKTQPKGISADILILAHAKKRQEEFPGRQIIIATKNIADFTIFEQNYLDICVSDWKNIKI